jgi:hypothetical protein
MKDAAVAKGWGRYRNRRVASSEIDALDPNCLNTIVKGDVVAVLVERFG